MAVIKPTITAVGRGDGSTLQAIWTPVTEADSCAAISYPECSDKSIQAIGTFGGSSVALNGSNYGTTYAALRDPGGTTIALSSAGIKAVLENTTAIQPSITGGTNQSLTIAMLLHLTNPLRQ
jgi:hypothetical protein